VTANTPFRAWFRRTTFCSPNPFLTPLKNASETHSETLVRPFPNRRPVCTPGGVNYNLTCELKNDLRYIGRVCIRVGGDLVHVTMHTGQTVIVCGADGDHAQFEPFEWPEYGTLWFGVGCGYVRSFGCLPPYPADATEDGCIEVARAYVRAVHCPPSDVESAVLALSGWLRIVERAAQVPCSVIIACGGVRVSAIPVVRAWWSRRTITIVGDGIRKTVRRKGNQGAVDEMDEHDEIESYARRVLTSRGIDHTHEYRSVRCGPREIEMHPRDRCALCDRRVQSIFRDHTKAIPAGVCAHSCASQVPSDAPVEWLPTLTVCNVCSACPTRTFEVWRTFNFTLDEGKGCTLEAPTERAHRAPTARAHDAIFGQGAHESAWLANARVVETIALALVAHAVPCKGTFAASLAAALCDLKLLRVVAERMLPPPPRIGAHRALACYTESRVQWNRK